MWVSELQPDVTLVDLNLGGESGFELATRLCQDGPHRSGVILISMRSREDCGDLIAASRARGFVSKTALVQVNNGYRVWHRLAGGARLLYSSAVANPDSTVTVACDVVFVRSGAAWHRSGATLRAV